eukprot:15285846-Ditylum_brightwellii.AAC.2
MAKAMYKTNKYEELEDILNIFIFGNCWGIFDMCPAWSQLIVMSFMTSNGIIYEDLSRSKDYFSSFIAYSKSTMVKNDITAIKNATEYYTHVFQQKEQYKQVHELKSLPQSSKSKQK